MKRMHVHLSVADLPASIRFYSELFAAEPSVRKSDYAKWMLDDPRVNLAISQRGIQPGLDHVGIQVDSDEELRTLASRLRAAGQVTRDQEGASCCYAQSNKSWVTDPSGLRWESFFTFGQATSYGEDEEPQAPVKAGSCCAPSSNCC